MNKEYFNGIGYDLLGVFDDVEQCFNKISDIFDTERKILSNAFDDFLEGRENGDERAVYPFIAVKINDIHAPIDPRRSYGFVRQNGYYITTVTQPDLLRDYLMEQLYWLSHHYECSFYVGRSDQCIPLYFIMDAHMQKKLASLSSDRIKDISRMFQLPDLSVIDDNIADGVNENLPYHHLSLFDAPRVDFSLQRLKHYTGTSPKFFSRNVLFTNYPFYVDEFMRIARHLMTKGNSKDIPLNSDDYIAFIEPGDQIHINQNIELSNEEKTLLKSLELLRKEPQMPAYHLVGRRKKGTANQKDDSNPINNHGGITLINIGVGPSNAKNITDHLAVLRPDCWLMLGHCAGLRQSQRIGDYVLAHSYLREDHVLDDDLPTWVPIPPLSEIQIALEDAVSKIAGMEGYELKQIMRTGTVATTDNRNWELQDHETSLKRFSQARAIAVDMESATIAANGLRFRVPYGTLLCISDKPVHGEIKLPGVADHFYRERVNQHLLIGLEAMKILQKIGPKHLHSRKLRTFDEPAFR